MSQIESFTRPEKEALVRASRDRLRFGENLRPVVTIGRDEYRREDLISCTYEGSDGFAMLADLSFRNRVPRDIEQKPISIGFEVDTPTGTQRLRGFVGYTLRRRAQGFSITGATGGYEAERTPLGRGPAQDREFNGVAPGRGLFDAMQPLRRRYAGYEIPPVAKPLLYRQGPERFTWNMYAKEVCDYCAEQGQFVIADTPTNVAFAYTLGGIDRDAPPAWHFEKGVDCADVGDETPDGERYARVIVHSQPDDTGRVLRLAEAEVDNRGYDVFGGSTLMHPLEPETDGDSASVAAYRLARQLGRNDTGVTVEANYPPFFLRRGDVCSATGKEFRIADLGRASSARNGSNGHRESGTLIIDRYLFRVETMSVDALALSGSVGGEGIHVGTETREMTLPQFDRIGFYPLWGYLPDARSPFFDTALPWMRKLDETSAELDTDIAAAHGVTATDLGDGRWEFSDEE